MSFGSKKSKTETKPVNVWTAEQKQIGEQLSWLLQGEKPGYRKPGTWKRVPTTNPWGYPTWTYRYIPGEYVPGKDYPGGLLEPTPSFPYRLYVPMTEEERSYLDVVEQAFRPAGETLGRTAAAGPGAALQWATTGLMGPLAATQVPFSPYLRAAGQTAAYALGLTGLGATPATGTLTGLLPTAAEAARGVTEPYLSAVERAFGPATTAAQQLLPGVTSVREALETAMQAAQRWAGGQLPYEVGPEWAERYFEEAIRPVYEREFREKVLPQIRAAYAGPGYWGSARAQAEREAAEKLAETLMAERAKLMYGEELARREAIEKGIQAGLTAAQLAPLAEALRIPVAAAAAYPAAEAIEAAFRAAALPLETAQLPLEAARVATTAAALPLEAIRALPAEAALGAAFRAAELPIEAAKYIPLVGAELREAAALPREIEHEKIMAQLQRWLSGEELEGRWVPAYSPYVKLALAYLGLTPYAVGTTTTSKSSSFGLPVSIGIQL